MGIINNFFGMILNLIFEGVAMLTPMCTLGITIIVFTIVTRLLLTPLQIKQMRTTRAMSKIQPELQKIQKKYENKKDQQSQMAYSQELQGLYKKYKISPFAGCLPMLIQFPLIIALYNVLRMPSRYIARLGDLYTQIADILTKNIPNIEEVVTKVTQQLPLNQNAVLDIKKLGDAAQLSDTLSHFNTDQWALLKSNVSPQVYGLLENLLDVKHGFEYFLVNLVDSPSQLVANGQYLALLIPVLAGASTFIFSKITMAASQPTQGTDNNPANSMIKTMNIVMPIMMGVFSYQVANGLALYWIASNIIMMFQQIWVNKIVDKQQAVLEEQLRKDREAAKAKEGVKKKKKKRPKPQTEDGQTVKDSTSDQVKKAINEDNESNKVKNVTKEQTSESKKED